MLPKNLLLLVHPAADLRIQAWPNYQNGVKFQLRISSHTGWIWDLPEVDCYLLIDIRNYQHD